MLAVHILILLNPFRLASTNVNIGEARCLSVNLYKIAWCGACRNFEPIWSKFVQDSYKYASSFVSFNVRDCSVVDCQEISHVPTVHLISPNSEPSEIETSNLENSFLSLVLQLSAPLLSPLVPQSSLPPSPRVVYVSADTYDKMAVRLWLYFSSYGLPFAHLTARSLLLRYNATQLLLLYEAGHPTLVLKDSDSFSTYSSAFASIHPLGPRRMECPSNLDAVDSSEFTPFDGPPTRQDVLSTVRHMVLMEVSSHGVIEGPQKRVFFSIVDLLAQLVTFSDDLTKCLNGLKSMESGATVDTSIFRQFCGSLPSQWVHCRGSQRRYRGYPCGLWVLFHYLTIQQSRLAVRPNHVLLCISDYVAQFFTCRDCANHFAEFVPNMTLVDSHRLAVLFLQRAHNSVNMRIKGSLTEDPFHRKVQFPPRLECAACYTRGEQVDSEVLKFMGTHYLMGHSRGSMAVGIIVFLSLMALLLICLCPKPRLIPRRIKPHNYLL